MSSLFAAFEGSNTLVLSGRTVNSKVDLPCLLKIFEVVCRTFWCQPTFFGTSAYFAVSRTELRIPKASRAFVCPEETRHTYACAPPSGSR